MWARARRSETSDRAANGYRARSHRTGMRSVVPLAAVGVLVLLVSAAEAQTAPAQVHVTTSVVGFGNYDAKQGTYVLDFYLVLSWNNETAPADFSPDAFEFANGRATSRELQYDILNETTGMRELWYRVQANLYSEPQYQWYPFDHQSVEIRLEDTLYPARQLVYVPNIEKSGLEDAFSAAGWVVRDTEFMVTTNDYSFDEPYSQARFVITLQRSVVSGVLKVIIPPLAFVAISAASFLLLGGDKIATRFALSGNMAISGVMFHGAQSASLPSLSRLIFLDRYMLAIDVALFGSVVVTALVAIAELKKKDAKLAKRLNLRGAIITAIAAGGAFALLSIADRVV